MRRKRKSKIKAPATVFFAKVKDKADPDGPKKLAVFAECHYGGTRVGPIWGHGKASVDKCLATMTAVCDCGRVFHHHKYTEGQRIVGKAAVNP